MIVTAATHLSTGSIPWVISTVRITNHTVTTCNRVHGKERATPNNERGCLYFERGQLQIMCFCSKRGQLLREHDSNQRQSNVLCQKKSKRNYIL